jgi:hypothetical protein
MARRSKLLQATAKGTLESLLNPAGLLSAAIAAGLMAQSYFGTVTGVLTDPTRAVIPLVNLILTDKNKGYSFSAISDDTGRYLYRSIPPGAYSLTAQMR